MALIEGTPVFGKRRNHREGILNIIKPAHTKTIELQMIDCSPRIGWGGEGVAGQVGLAAHP